MRGQSPDLRCHWKLWRQTNFLGVDDISESKYIAFPRQFICRRTKSERLAIFAVTGLEAERDFLGRPVMEIRHDPFCLVLCCGPARAV